MTLKERRHPPLLGRLILRLLPLRERRDEVESDVFELFTARLSQQGQWRAGWRYVTDTAPHESPGAHFLDVRWHHRRCRFGQPFVSSLPAHSA